MLTIKAFVSSLQVEELLNGARVVYVREDDVEEAIAELSALLKSLSVKRLNGPKGEAAKYLERMGMPQVTLLSSFVA